MNGEPPINPPQAQNAQPPIDAMANMQYPGGEGEAQLMHFEEAYAAFVRSSTRQYIGADGKRRLQLKFKQQCVRLVPPNTPGVIPNHAFKVKKRTAHNSTYTNVMPRVHAREFFAENGLHIQGELQLRVKDAQLRYQQSVMQTQQAVAQQQQAVAQQQQAQMALLGVRGHINSIMNPGALVDDVDDDDEEEEDDVHVADVE